MDDFLQRLAQVTATKEWDQWHGNRPAILVVDEANAFQRMENQAVTLFALFDCCFSGTVLDLKYQYLDSLDNNLSTVNKNETETK